MASPTHVSGGVPAPRKTRIVGHEVSRNRARNSRLTKTQIVKLAKEECDQLMCSVSSIYSPAELEGVQKEALEFEPDCMPRDDPQRPHPPEDHAPLEDFQRLRLLDGLDGVLNSGRGKIDNWLDNLKTQERQEQLQEIDEWFVQFQDKGPELVSFFRNCETEVEQGRVLCQRSENLVNKLTQETAHTRQEVAEFVDHKLKPMAGGGQGGMVHAVEKKRMIAQMNHDHARLGYETVEQQIQEVDAALEQVKQDFYDFRLSRMRMQQAEQDDIHELQNDIEKRQQALTKLNEEVEQKAQLTKTMESFVKFGRRCTREGRRVESKDPELDQLATKYRDYALNRKRHIRTVVCKRIDDIERQEQEDRNAISILRDWAREANLEMKTKENVMEMVSTDSKKRQASATDSQEGKQNEGELQTQARIKEELIQTLKNIRFEKGRIEDAIKKRKVIVDAITQGEDARAEVRRQFRRGMVKTMHFLAEEEQEVRRVVGMPQLLPSTWQGQMQREWVAEVKPAAELYAHVLFASRLAGNAEEETARTGRSSENVERLKDLVGDAEALWYDLRDLELKLTPAGVHVEEADLLAEAGREDLEEPWFGQERVNQHRLDDLRSLEQEMFEQARKVAADLTAESCLLEGVNMAEVLRMQSKNPKRLVRKGTSKKLV